MSSAQLKAGRLVPDELPEIQVLEQRFKQLAQAGLSSPFYPEVNGRSAWVDLSSYDYLALARHPAVKAASVEALEQWGTSLSGPRVLRGDLGLQQSLEAELAQFLGTPAALTLVSGFLTNSSLIPHLIERGDLILHDELMHHSALAGAVASRARRQSFAHNDLGDLERQLLTARAHRRVLVIVEGLYSMDGDVCDLPGLLALRERFGFLLMVDEAHSLGVLGATGRGVAEHFGLPRPPDVLWTGTLSKALASCGGFILGTHRFIHYLRHTLPGALFSVGMTPASAAAARQALRVLAGEPERVSRLAENSRLLQESLLAAGGRVGTALGRGVIPLLLGGDHETYRLAGALRDQGVLASPVVPPAVRPGQGRLRFFVTAQHSGEELRRVARLVGEQLERP